MAIMALPISVEPYARSVNAATDRTVPPLPFNTGTSDVVLLQTGAVFADESPYDGEGEAQTGRQMLTSFDDWYYRIHVFPAQLVLGNLVGNQQRGVTLWNAYLAPVDLENFTVLDGEGIVVTVPISAPAEVKPLKLLEYQFEITTDGPPVIEATAVWTFDGIEYSVPFTGRRIVVFPFRPNWSGAVEETLEWNTVLDTSYTGKEQITEVRSKPRRILQYGFRIHETDLNRFDNVMFGWTARLFAAPLWQEKTKLTSAAAAGDIVMQAATDNRTFETGSLALLFKDVANYEIVEIASAVPTAVQLARPLTAAWPAGALLYPMMVAAPEAGVSTTRQIDTHADGLVRFTVSPADNYIRLPVTTPPLLYRGHELYLGETNWSAPLGVENAARQNLVDEGTGVTRLIRRAAYPLIQRGFRWLVGNKDDAELLRQFFGRRRGRLKPVWIASGTRDFVLSEEASLSATTLYTVPNDYGTFVNMHPARRDVLIMLRSGQKFPRRIVSYGVDAQGRGAMVIDSALGTGIAPSDVKRISYLGFYRLASDSITFSWRTDEVAVIETNFVLKESP